MKKNRWRKNVKTWIFSNFQLSKGHGGDQNLAEAVLSKLPELRSIGARHVSYLEWFRLHWHMLKLPPLFAEIFDIPKCEEDLHQGWIILSFYFIVTGFFFSFHNVSFFYVKRIGYFLMTNKTCLQSKAKNINNDLIYIYYVLCVVTNDVKQSRTERCTAVSASSARNINYVL